MNVKRPRGRFKGLAAICEPFRLVSSFATRSAVTAILHRHPGLVPGSICRRALRTDRRAPRSLPRRRVYGSRDKPGMTAAGGLADARNPPVARTGFSSALAKSSRESAERPTTVRSRSERRPPGAPRATSRVWLRTKSRTSMVFPAAIRVRVGMVPDRSGLWGRNPKAPPSALTPQQARPSWCGRFSSATNPRSLFRNARALADAATDAPGPTLPVMSAAGAAPPPHGRPVRTRLPTGKDAKEESMREGCQAFIPMRRLSRSGLSYPARYLSALSIRLCPDPFERV